MMTRRLFPATTGAILAAALGTAAPAEAQQVTQSTFGALEEIVVTARRREEAIQSVPIAITALSQDKLTENRVLQFNDLQHYVPSFRQFQSASRRESDQISIRSLPGALSYFAEAPTIRTGAGRFYDLQNVQILKGPQGTLFGGLANGGAILFEPRRPTNNTEGYASVTFGNYNNREFEGALNVPIVDDKVMIRLAGTRQERAGFTTDIGPFFPGKKYDNRDHWSWRLGMLVKPMEWLQNYTVYEGYYRHTNATGNKLLAVNPAGNIPRVFPNYQTVLDQQNAIGPRATALSTDQLDKVYDWIGVNITQIELLENIRFKNIFSWAQSKSVDRYEFEGSILRITDRPNDTGWRASSKTFSNEANLQGDFFGDKLRLTGGFYWEGGRPLEIAAQRAFAFNVLSNVPETGHPGNFRTTMPAMGRDRSISAPCCRRWTG
jgi:iron complex outermembrane recepter protein